MASPSLRAPEHSQPRLVPHYRYRRVKRPSNGFPRILIVMLASLLLLMIIVAYRSISPRSGLRAPGRMQMRAGAGELKMQDVQVYDILSNGTLILQGQLFNTASSFVGGATVQLAFRDAHGNVVSTIQQPISMLAGGQCGHPNAFAESPIKPHELRFFCVSVDPIPDAWNHQIPDMQVVSVTSD